MERSARRPKRVFLWETHDEEREEKLRTAEWKQRRDEMKAKNSKRSNGLSTCAEWIMFKIQYWNIVTSGSKGVQGYDLNLRGTDANFGVLCSTHCLQFTAYSTAAKRDRLAGRDRGKQIWQLSWSAFSFFITSAVGALFPCRLRQKVTAESRGQEKMSWDLVSTSFL